MNYLKRTENIDARKDTSNPGCSTFCENHEQMDEFYPDLSEYEQNEQVNESDLFSIDNDPEVVFDDDTCEISMPKIFEDETKFSEPISEKWVVLKKLISQNSWRICKNPRKLQKFDSTFD